MEESFSGVTDIDTTRTYSIKEVARILHFGERYVRELVRAGRIIGTKPGGNQIRVTGSELKRVLLGVQREGSAPTRRAAAESDVDVIEVPPENADRMFPPRDDPNEKPEGEDMKIGYQVFE